MEIIIYCVAFAYVWINILQMPYRFNRVMDFKPLNCGTCLSGWLTLIFSGFHWHTIGYMCIGMILHIIIDGIIRKI